MKLHKNYTRCNFTKINDLVNFEDEDDREQRVNAVFYFSIFNKKN